MNQKLLGHMYQNSLWQAEVIGVINSILVHETPMKDNSTLQPHYHRQYAERFRGTLLALSKYRDMESRYEGIAHAYKRTFDWIFSPSLEGQNWYNFAEWLQSDETLYWITGKPGAGKSTLMKFICDDIRTQESLRIWAAGEQLFVLSFYFWNSGASVQMSQEGLLRTLLYDSLQRLPELIPQVFPTRLETFIMFGDHVASHPISWTELLRAFKLFVQEATKFRRVVFFIDVLDEFVGSHSQLIAFIQSLLEYKVKICVSSRPWNVFEDGFKSRPHLRLEDLTFSDIRHFVSSKLLANPGFHALQQFDAENADQLINNVTIKASGVFLWVDIVTHSLLEGLSDGEHLSELQERLDELPDELENLFWKILDSLSPQQFERASHLFQIYRAARKPVIVIKLSYADEEDPDLVLDMPVTKVVDSKAQARLRSRAELMRRRLAACCKGLLEVYGNDRIPLEFASVGYLHRTVNDFFARKDSWDRLLQATKKGFDLNLRLCASQIAYLKISDMPNMTFSSFWDEVATGIDYAALSHASKEQERWLNGIDAVAATYQTQWTCSHEESRHCSSFLHLATKLQLVPYIMLTIQPDKKEHEKKKRRKEECDKLSSLLEIATLQYDMHNWDAFRNTSLCHSEPNLDLISFLFNCGADPNYVSLRHGRTIWTDVVVGAKPEVLKLFVLHGANLSLPRASKAKFDEEMRAMIDEKTKKKPTRLSSMWKRFH